MTIEAMKAMANYIDVLGGDSKKYRQAIAEAEKQEPVAVIGSGFQLLWCRQDWSKGLKVGDCLYTHPQPKQEQGEPVAWFREEDEEKIYYATKAWDDCLPLYTTPQPNVTTSDMKQEHVDKTAKQRHEENT
jgi:hypothetical protein